MPSNGKMKAMTDEKRHKKKVYVETMVISYTTALPSKDLILAGRQIVSRKWLDAAKSRYDEGLEEIWRIKREIAAEYSAHEDYFEGMMDYQEELTRQGVQFVRLPPRKPEPEMV